MRDQNFSSEQQEVDEKLQLLDLLLADEKDGDGKVEPPIAPRASSHHALRRLGQKIRRLRQAKDWTQEDLAAECVLDRSYVSGLETGRRNPTYLNLLKIAKTLDVTLAALLDLD